MAKIEKNSPFKGRADIKLNIDLDYEANKCLQSYGLTTTHDILELVIEQLREKMAGRTAEKLEEFRSLKMDLTVVLFDENKPEETEAKASSRLGLALLDD